MVGGDTRMTTVQLPRSEQNWRQLQEDETHGIPLGAQCVERTLTLTVESLEMN